MSMNFHVITLFPEVCRAYTDASVLGRAQKTDKGKGAKVRGKKISVSYYNPRDFTTDKHHKADDRPYGGGPGMVIKAEPIVKAWEKAVGKKKGKVKILLMSPRGKTFDQATAKKIAKQYDHLVLISGRYEGIDARVKKILKAEEVSVGDYVLTGGELPALILIDAVARLLPEVLGDPTGAEDDSHAMGLLEYPHYTKPAEFRGWKVPDILTSGDHGKIDKWRREQALERTFRKRPDMLEKAELTKDDLKFIEKLKNG